MSIIWLEAESVCFPDIDLALDEPNGLLAAGGDLTLPWLELAYSKGIFPWFEQGQPILWWSPDPRMVLHPSDSRVSRSMAKFLRTNPFRVTMDTCFSAVIEGCSQSRRYSSDTWITDGMKRAYVALHEAGTAHSVEVWLGDELVGGLYGVAKGKVFFGESMFSRRDNASKVAFAFITEQLNRWGFHLIDCQVSSEHLISLGAFEISRQQFSVLLARYTLEQSGCSSWQFDDDLPLSWKSKS
jgi:leucyl/phenylalanyl-tRNA--protein transferase